MKRVNLVHRMARLPVVKADVATALSSDGNQGDYYPKVIVADLSRDYGSVIALVFPKAQHHERLFHAEQEISRYLRDALGRDSAQQHPEAENVGAEIVKVFQVQTRQVAEARYQAWLTRHETVRHVEPALVWVFEFLEHRPYLVNSYVSQILDKLDLTSRAQAAAYAARHHIEDYLS